MSSADPEVEAVEQAPTYQVDARLIVKAIVGLGVIVLVAYLCGVYLREPITTFGQAAIDRFGLYGLFAGVIVTDASPLPLTNEPLVFLALGADVDAWTIFWVVSSASVTAGAVGYTCGRTVGDATPLGRFLRRRYPGFDHFMKKYGAYGVAICALLPIPFALSTWTAGMMRLRFWQVMLATLVRFPKTAFYVWLIVAGWAAGGS